jgi:hypothetical protein
MEGKMSKSKASRIAVLGVIVAISLFSVNSARAHQSHNMRITIPFDFYVSDKLMPAAEYEVFGWDNAVRVYNPATRLTAGIQTQALGKDTGAVVMAKVVFNRYGEEYFISEIWWGGRTGAGNVPVLTKRELELAKTFSPVRIEDRAAR